MAARHTSAKTRENYYRAGQEPMYVYGNAVPKPANEPKKRVSKPQKKVSHQVKRNRRKALRVNQGYVVFLGIAAILALVVCVNYIQLQSKLTSRSKNITAMQKELADMKEENNTRYNAVMDSVNLDEIREKAQKELGMVYASSDQVVEYQSPSSDYVKQYEDIPEDGVLAQSDKK
ncbi:MAG: hypothetical protein ACI4S2_01285 [Lachnospiraceae bacterium]